MQLNDFTDYGLRVLVYAGASPAARHSTAAVAKAFGISRHHMVKVVHALQGHGFIDTTRGRGGGFRLARAPETIRVGDVVRRMESTLALVECFRDEDARCPLTPACGLKRALADAQDAFMASLDRWTVADCLAAPQWSARVRRLHLVS
jgi:Rrf2 family nitric oxide-sensitive transcriptional repressor